MAIYYCLYNYVSWNVWFKFHSKTIWKFEFRTFCIIYLFIVTWVRLGVFQLWAGITSVLPVTAAEIPLSNALNPLGAKLCGKLHLAIFLHTFSCLCQFGKKIQPRSWAFSYAYIAKHLHYIAILSWTLPSPNLSIISDTIWVDDDCSHANKIVFPLGFNCGLKPSSNNKSTEESQTKLFRW